MAGALSGIRIIEFSGIGPAPFCGMMLADHGADVICIERLGALRMENDALGRNKRTILLDLHQPNDLEIAIALTRTADGLIEGFRPGVMERLGLGPEDLHPINPSLIYGRMTGWGQTGPWAQTAGHDINYIALAGILHGIGSPDRPPVRSRPSRWCNFGCGRGPSSGGFGGDV